MAPKSSKNRWTLVNAPVVCALSALACSAPATAPPGASGGMTGSGASSTGASGGTGNVGNPSGGAAGVGGQNPGGGAGGTTQGGGAGGSGATGGGQGGGVSNPNTFSNYQLNGAWPELTSVIATVPNPNLQFTKVTVHTQFLAESCSIADYNNDGNPDISSGKRWWEGPDFTVEHPFRDGHTALPREGLQPEIDTGVSDDWSDFPWDVNGDGFADIINISNCDVPNTAIQFAWDPISQDRATAFWYENPGGGWEGNPPWTPHLIHSDMRHEHKSMFDVNGDGKPEIVGACKGCNPNETKGFYYADWANPGGAWTYQPVSNTVTFPFNGTGWMHGLGFGDVNGDGKPDMLDNIGIWVQGADQTQWSLIEQVLYDGNIDQGQKGAAHMYAWDIDGDGDQDIYANDWAHGERLAWYEQTTPGSFTKHYFMGSEAEADQYGGVYFSQPHSAQAVDMDGDGVRDLITGKMRFAHPNGYGDPDITGPAEVYIFRVVQDPSKASGSAIFEPHKIDMDATGDSTGTGVGRQISVGHINTDGKVDICTATKLGLFVYLAQ